MDKQEFEKQDSDKPLNICLSFTARLCFPPFPPVSISTPGVRRGTGHPEPGLMQQSPGGFPDVPAVPVCCCFPMNFVALELQD